MMKNNHLIWTALVLITIIVAAVALHSPKSSTLDEEAMSRLPEETPDQISTFHPELQEKFNSTLSLLNIPIGGFHQNFIRLKPGESREIYYTFYTRNAGPANVSYGIHRVKGVYETEQIAMPDGLNVSIVPSSFIGEANKNYTSKITINTNPELTYRGAGSTYTLYLQADFEGENETEGNDWVRVLIEGEETVPGASGLFSSHGSLHDNSMTLEQGKEGNAYYTIHIGGEGLSKVNYKVYRVKSQMSTQTISEDENLPLPEGLNVSIEPSNFIARNFEDYTSKIIVKTGMELAPGEYILCIEVATSGMLTNDLLTVNVI